MIVDTARLKEIAEVEFNDVVEDAIDHTGLKAIMPELLRFLGGVIKWLH